jgi:hypothetical protein
LSPQYVVDPSSRSGTVTTAAPLRAHFRNSVSQDSLAVVVWGDRYNVVARLNRESKSRTAHASWSGRRGDCLIIKKSDHPNAMNGRKK